jgi:16S rRNA (cytosine967-C5)-methyltransferase
MTARSMALRALREWRKKDRFADVVMADLLSHASLRENDRAFARELFYGVLRNLRLLDFWIGLLREEKLDAISRDLLRVGLYQLFLLRTPAHAAINETVALANRKNRGLVNAVLRTAQRSEQELLSDANAQSLGVRFSHPDFLIARWTKNFGEKTVAALAEFNNRPAPVYARINRLKIEPNEFFAAHPAQNRALSRPDFFEAERLPSDAIDAGLIYVQDPSTTIACELLDPQPGEKLLDACAAPGGKTCLLAQQMKNCGVIVACDREERRLITLRENLSRLGVEIATVGKVDWTQQNGSQLKDEFDRILIDAPCSNTGVMRRRVDVRWRVQPTDFMRMQKRQLAIADKVVPLLKPRSVMVYSTCSLEPEENEELVAQLLKKFRHLELVEQKIVTPFADGFDGAFAAKFRRDH